jgi:hypothetical protein
LPSGEYIITSSYNGVNVANIITITGWDLIFSTTFLSF